MSCMCGSAKRDEGLDFTDSVIPQSTNRTLNCVNIHTASLYEQGQTNIPIVLCFQRSTFPLSYIPKALIFHYPMFPKVYITIVL